MKNLKLTTIFIFIMLLAISCNSKKAETDNYVDLDKEKKAVTEIMKAYKDGIQELKTDGLINLFAQNSEVYESGGDEGSFAHYLEHHLAPELTHFKSFKFTDYTINMEIYLPFAFVTEKYIYHIEIPQKNEGEEETIRTISRKGIATSILRKIDGKWKIIKTHSSARNYKKQ